MKTNLWKAAKVNMGKCKEKIHGVMTANLHEQAYMWVKGTVIFVLFVRLFKSDGQNEHILINLPNVSFFFM